MRDKQKAAPLTRWPYSTLVSPGRTTYCPGYVFGFCLLLRDERDSSLEGKADIVRELERNTVTILVGETGSGKTTREPNSQSPVYLSLIHTKRYPSTFLRQVSPAENALRSPNQGGSLLHLSPPASPRSKGFLWAHPSDIPSALTSVAARARRSSSSRMGCWFGN